MGLLDILCGKAKLRKTLDKLDPVVKPKLAKLIAKELGGLPVVQKHPELAAQVVAIAPAIADRTVDLVEELIVGAL